MKQVIVGVYEIGWEQVQVVLREGTGGEFYSIPEKGSLARIKIGADYRNWNDVVAVLLHEASELMYDRLQCRYMATNHLAGDHTGYLFMANHAQFSDVCWKVGELAANCLPDLQKAWKRWGDAAKRKKK